MSFHQPEINTFVWSLFTDPRTCADQPCFEGVECTVVDPYTLEWKTMEIVRRFACGDCPEGFTGDGEVCKSE